VFAIVPVAFLALGICLVLWPARVILLNRDDDEKGAGPPTAGQVLRARVLGVVLIAGGGYGLYALLTGMPGAEFFPV
jgi:hypothetical protein